MEKKGVGKIVFGIVTLVIVLIAAMMFGLPRYNVWQQEMAGKAEMAKAEYFITCDDDLLKKAEKIETCKLRR